jgi:hypothetical protein
MPVLPSFDVWAVLIFVLEVLNNDCYNPWALQESRSGGRCRAKSFEASSGRGKSEHYRAASQLTAGHWTGKRAAHFMGRARPLPGDDKCNREKTSQRGRGTASRPSRDKRVMGETVRPQAGLNVRAHRRMVVTPAARQTPRSARPNREASTRAARPMPCSFRRARYDLRVGRSIQPATVGLDE